jgi:hypothetical protein
VALLELPNGDFIDPQVVRAIQAVVADNAGPRVLIEAAVTSQVVLLKFPTAEDAAAWAVYFAKKVNAALAATATLQ